MNYELVPMDKSHLPQAAALEREVFSHPWTEELLEQELYQDTVSLVAAEGEDGTLLGYGEIRVILDEGCLEKIVVAPAYRRQGVAEAILGAFCRFGAEKLAFLTLEVRETNAPAIALYRKLGFEEVGRRKNYYAELHEDAILMTRTFRQGG